MRRMITTGLFALLLAAVLSVSTLAPPASARPSDEMSTERAGRYYLKTVCATVPAATRYSTRIWKGRRSITVAEVRGRLPELRRLSLAYGDALRVEARRLYNPPADWPATVAAHVEKFAETAAREATARAGQGYASTAAEWGRYARAGNRANEAAGAHPSIIRAALDLPAPGKGC